MKTEVGPSYPWYASDFLGSTRVQRMTPLEEFCYRRLLDTQFAEGSIPADVGKMARICKNIPVGQMKRVWTVIAECFVEQGDGTYINRKMASIRNEIIEYRRERSEAGKLGNKVKQERRNGQAKPHAERNAVNIAKRDAELDAERIAKRTPPLPTSPSPSHSQDPIPINTARPPDPASGGRAGELLGSVRNHWQAVLRYIRKEHANAEEYAELFKPIEVASASGDFLILRVPPLLVANYDGDIGEAQADLMRLIEKSGADFLRDRKLALEVLD